MSEKPKPAQTQLRITACSSVYTGKHPNGHSYTIFEIEAVRPDGTVVAENLRSFEELPEGDLLDLNVVKYMDDHGTSYTLSRRGGSGNAQKIKDLEGRVAALEESVRQLLPLLTERPEAGHGTSTDAA